MSAIDEVESLLDSTMDQLNDHSGCIMMNIALRLCRNAEHLEAEITDIKTQLAERDRRLEAMTKLIAYCDSCIHFGNRTPDGMGACMRDKRCWQHVSPDDYRPECFAWRDPVADGGGINRVQMQPVRLHLR